jgi:hypothetical protein
MDKIIKYPVVIFLLMITSCVNKEMPVPAVSEGKTDESFMVADTIIYDVIIKNNDAGDDWSSERLHRLQHQKLINSIFDMVYSEKVAACEFFTGEPLKPAEIKRLEAEKEFSRENIGKMQFTERWYFDNASARMQKDVLSIVLGYELFGDSGEFRGYKPVFKVSLNP